MADRHHPTCILVDTPHSGLETEASAAISTAGFPRVPCSSDRLVRGETGTDGSTCVVIRQRCPEAMLLADQATGGLGTSADRDTLMESIVSPLASAEWLEEPADLPLLANDMEMTWYCRLADHACRAISSVRGLGRHTPRRQSVVPSCRLW